MARDVLAGRITLRDVTRSSRLRSCSATIVTRYQQWHAGLSTKNEWHSPNKRDTRSTAGPAA